jgi:bacterioferritin-associated ferredoxin
MMSEMFWSFLITSAVAVCTLTLRMLYKSKCVVIDCGNCVHIVRDTITENKELEMVTHQNTDSDKSITDSAV